MKNFLSTYYKLFNTVFSLFALFAVLFIIYQFAGHDGLFYAVTILPTTALAKVNLRTEEAWPESQLSVERVTLADAFATQLRLQNNLGGQLIQTLTNTDKDTDVRVWWYDFCGTTASDCDADTLCGDLDANEGPIAYKDYTIAQCITAKFGANEVTFAGSTLDMQDYIVGQQNNVIRDLIELLDKKYILALHANSGAIVGTPYAQNVSNQGVIPSAAYANTNAFAQLILDARRSKIQRPFVIDSGQWDLTLLQAKFNAGNDTGKGDAARAGYFDITVDPAGFASAGASVATSTFLVSPYALAYVNKNYYKNDAPIYDDAARKYKYRIYVPAYRTYIDVLHQRICVDAKKDRYRHVFNYTLWYDFLVNPKGCDLGGGKFVTGIAEYTKGA